MKLLRYEESIGLLKLRRIPLFLKIPVAPSEGMDSFTWGLSSVTGLMTTFSTLFVITAVVVDEERLGDVTTWLNVTASVSV